MNIITYSEGLQQRMKEFLASSSDDLVTVGKALKVIRELLLELKQYTVRYEFSSTQEEVYFFKEVKPVVLSQYFFHKKKFEILLFDSFQDVKDRVSNYYDVLQKLQHFANRHQTFYEYCMSGCTQRDNQYFLRSTVRFAHIGRDEKFSTSRDTTLAKILGNEMIRDYVLKAIHKSQNNSVNANKSLQWTTSKVALVELIYALYSAGVFNYGKTEVKKIVETFEQMLSIDLGNYARVFSEIRIRKNGQTTFLDLLKDCTNRLINDLE